MCIMWTLSLVGLKCTIQHCGSSYFCGGSIISGGLDFLLLTDGDLVQSLDTAGFMEDTDRWLVIEWDLLSSDISLLSQFFPRVDVIVSENIYRLVVPFWLILLIPAFLYCLPYAYLVIFRRTKFTGENGLCTCCGYDLQGGNERCPECGTPTKHKG